MRAKQTEDIGIGILKSIWKNNTAGIWIMHDLNGIDLKPSEDFEKDYFQIEDEIIELGKLS